MQLSTDTRIKRGYRERGGGGEETEAVSASETEALSAPLLPPAFATTCVKCFVFGRKTRSVSAALGGGDLLSAGSACFLMLGIGHCNAAADMVEATPFLAQLQLNSTEVEVETGGCSFVAQVGFSIFFLHILSSI